MQEKISTFAMYGGSGSAIVFGLTPGEWSVIGIIVGIVVAVAGYITNSYLGWQRLKLDRENANASGR